VRESAIEQRCKTIAEKHGCFLLKVEKRKGWPDRMLLCPNGMMAWIEFKRPGENLSKFQEHIHDQLTLMHFRVHTVDNYSEFLTALLYLKGLVPPNGSLSTTK